MKSKTIALWLTLVGGPLGLHRVYLRGRYDALSGVLTAATLIGLYGVYRARGLGVDDQMSWLLIPLLGFTMAGCALNAIVYGLMSTESWNARFNPSAPSEASQGETGKLTVVGLAVALFLGTTVLMASLAFSFQRYFEYEVEATKSATSTVKKAAD
ncbi:MAG: hypothetical protein CFE43_18600 [Burkholderiales bacterium PBB3]|nr:MAG: hypothetical protein CFE43_18600 [Burkholderiales bacterium PBB3]